MSLEELSQKIQSELKKIEIEFSDFQNKSGIHCLSECGACCMNPEVNCHPYELLPLALDLYNRGLAEETLEILMRSDNGNCFLFKEKNASKKLGFCLEYQFRPSICRAFGVSGRKNKLGNVEVFTCGTLKPFELKINLNDYSEIPLINQIKTKLESIDPVFSSEEFSIKRSLKIILEKVLLYKQYEEIK